MLWVCIINLAHRGHPPPNYQPAPNAFLAGGSEAVQIEIGGDATVAFARAVRPNQDPEPPAIAFSEIESAIVELGFRVQLVERQPVTLRCPHGTSTNISKATRSSWF
ncbi:hypothetical protein CSHISOI_08806 [Colletotrichum shisoi]|uniref:Uncharacterized protein n=1 Tax=Colletotrichum shisoi TaxID=2078593 RepID=A0A5Q4BI83_9PEZI|nr:hypothetical protein CSHISOI_08806 [Colletotrichum shisoi]